MSPELGHPPANVLVLFGPTAVGKSEVALQAAEILNAEILSADSRQVYRGMDIGTAKPSTEIREKIPHHLIDIRNPDEPFNAALFKEEALKTILQIHKKGKVPMAVGGSFLYLKSLLEDYELGGIPPSPEKRLLWLEREKNEPGWLHQQVMKSQPELAHRLSPRNIPRLLRALEIIQKDPASPAPDSLPPSSTGAEAYPLFHSFGLLASRSLVYERIHQRVEQMFQRGLVEEVAGLIARYPPPYPLAFHSPGYQEVIDYLNGEISLTEAKDRVKKNTRHLAKRQFTWLKQFQFTPLMVEDERSRQSAVEAIVKKWLSLPEFS